MKKLLFLLLAVLVVCCGCGNKENDVTNVPEQNNNTVVENTQNQPEEPAKKDVEVDAKGEIGGESFEKNWEKLEQLDLNTADKVRESVANVSLTDEGNKYVIKTNENTSATYYHDGQKITGYEIRITYANNEEAEIAKNSYAREEGDNIESINVEGNDIIVKFTPEEYSDESLESIRQLYEAISVIQEH